MLKKSLVAIAIVNMFALSISAMNREMQREYIPFPQYHRVGGIESWESPAGVTYLRATENETLPETKRVKTSHIIGRIKPPVTNPSGTQLYEVGYIDPKDQTEWNLIAGKTKDGAVFVRLEKRGRENIEIENAQEIYDYIAKRELERRGK